MPDWAKDLAVRIPVVVVFAVVVLKMLKMVFDFLSVQQKAGAAARQEERDDRHKSMTEVQTVCHHESGRRQESLEDALKKSGEIHTETTRMLGRLDETVRRTNGHSNDTKGGPR